MVGHFIKVKCKKCGNEQIIFSKPAMVVKCLKCGEILARPTGGTAAFFCEILEKYD